MDFLVSQLNQNGERLKTLLAEHAPDWQYTYSEGCVCGGAFCGRVAGHSITKQNSTGSVRNPGGFMAILRDMFRLENSGVQDSGMDLFDAEPYTDEGPPSARVD